MIHSKSSQYALRSVLYLANQPRGTVCRLDEIAERERIPKHFLGKVLQRLARKRIVKSVKGLGGGFVLAVPPESISLYTIVDAIDDLSLSLSDCILGHGTCTEQQQCALHNFWKELREKELHFLRSNTIAHMTDEQHASAGSVHSKEKAPFVEEFEK